MFYAIQQDNEYILRFKYDPQLISIVKNVPGREWHPQGKYWSIPTSHLGWLLNGVKNTPYEKALQVVSDEHLNENASLDSTDKIPNIDISDIDIYVKDGSKLYEHQLDFLKYAKAKGQKGFILADDMGCLSGDTNVVLYINDHRYTQSMKWLYDRYHKPHSKGHYNFDSILKVRCCDPSDNTITRETIIDVVESGIKTVYKLELMNGYSIKLTLDHEVLTQRGFVEAQNLTTDDMVSVNGSRHCRFVPVRQFIRVGDEMTYDIKLTGPHHNFMANNIFVHNCGKTLEVINFALYQRKRYRYRHCLIITCVNTAKYSWLEDISKHTNGAEQAYILGTRRITRGKRKGQYRYNGSGQDKLDDIVMGHQYGDPEAPKLPYFIITNVEALGRTKKGKKFLLEDAIVQMMLDGDISIVAIDECHKNMSPSSTQGKVILDMKKRTGSSIQWIPMTGTPIKNKPLDVYTPLRLVDGHAFKNFYMWSQQFCIYGGYGNHAILGYKNIPMLKKMLQGNMLRRMTTEVLDLPPIIYYNEYVDNTPCQEALYQAICDELYENKEEILSSLNPLTAMLRLRQVNGSPELIDSSIELDDKYLSKNAKLAWLIDRINDIVESGEKTIIFSNWVEPLRTIYKYLRQNHKVCCYIGTMSEADREKHKLVFMNNPDYKILLGTISCMGESVTLTVAENVIFYDDCWTYADKTQCIKRANRIGSTKPLKVTTLMTKDTIDERVHQIIETKKGIAGYIVDDNIDLRQNPQLFDFLLGKGNTI